MSNNISIVLSAEFPFIPHTEQENKRWINKFFNLLSYTYLPLLRMCKKLQNEGIHFSFTIGFEGSLCAMLSNDELAKKYIQHLQNKIDFYQLELDRCKNCERKLEILNNHRDLLESNLSDFISYKKNILAEFDKYAQQGLIEILGTTITSAFLPFYMDKPESIAAQIEAGKVNFREFFTVLPTGFLIPGENGYINGLEKIIRSYSFQYSVLDTKAFLFSPKLPSYGIFAPATTPNNFTVFARDIQACNEVYGQENSFAKNPVYLDMNHDIGFELSPEYLSTLVDTSDGRMQTGFKYYSRAGNDQVYNTAEAKQHIKADAKTFVDNRIKTLNAVQKETNTSMPLVSVFKSNINLFGTTWFEGIQWLEEVFRYTAKTDEIKTETPGKILKNCKQIELITPFFSSSYEDGYAGSLITKDNNQMYKYIMKMTERMIDLTERFPDDTGLKARVLKLAATEVVLAQSTIWPLLANTSYEKKFAEKQFYEFVASFNTLFEALGSGVVSAKILTDRETLYPIFPELNYRSFSKRK